MDTEKSSAPAHPPKTRFARLEERYAHELVDAEERLELREEIVRVRKATKTAAAR